MNKKLLALLAVLLSSTAATAATASASDSTSTSSDEELAGTSDSLSNDMYAANYDDKAAHRRLGVNRRLNVDCDACNKTCEWYDVGCHAEKLACWLTGVTFEAFTSGVEAICNNDPDRTQAKELRDKATQILVDKKLFTAGELNSAKIRFCSALNLPEPDTGGMAPSRNKVLINTSYIQSTPKELAKLLAHEYTHIRQYERWGTDKFNCLYSKQILAGNGYGMKNWIEKEAYDFAQKASKIIDDDTPVSQTGIGPTCCAPAPATETFHAANGVSCWYDPDYNLCWSKAYISDGQIVPCKPEGNWQINVYPSITLCGEPCKTMENQCPEP